MVKQSKILEIKHIGPWLSLVERLVREEKDPFPKISRFFPCLQSRIDSGSAGFFDFLTISLFCSFLRGQVTKKGYKAF
jgi:hypothetical protein